LGNLVLVKVADSKGSRIIVETISSDLQLKLEKDPHFPRDPHALKAFLEKGDKASENSLYTASGEDSDGEYSLSEKPVGKKEYEGSGTAVVILFLAANPFDTNRLRLDKEIRSIDQALRKTRFRNQFKLEQQWALHVRDLQAHLLRYEPDIVHFSGHGSRSNELILENEVGNSQPVSGPSLSRLFSVLKDNVRCVVLNACFTEIQAKAIAKHIDCVIGMSREISDSAAIDFATSFYQALGYGRDVKTAFELACSELDLEKFEKREVIFEIDSTYEKSNQETLVENNVPTLIALNSDPSKMKFTYEST
ncbi:CHAT domain-containing protein, partial [bacterium]|nr:CHAT domain-containing protein [bacterium]